MIRFFSCILFCISLVLLSPTIGLSTTFDERIWEKYAEIQTPQGNSEGSLARLYLSPNVLGDMRGKSPFADLRVVTNRKEEVAWQIVTRRPEKIQEEIPHRMQNVSITEKGETWLELLIDKQGTTANAIDIVTPDTDFIRQVQVFGSVDGNKWNIIRKDGIIFDIPKMKMLRHTRITFPQTNFHQLMLKINNGEGQPLTIHDVKVLREIISQEQIYAIPGKVEKPEFNTPRKENSVMIRMNTIFPIDRLIIATSERNFQRTVEVQIKGETGAWQPWAQGTIYSFDTPTMHESQLAIDIPEIATKEFRLVLKNLDSPPLSITSVSGNGYHRLLVFKQSDQKMYLFWGNPLAGQPQYDLGRMVTKQNLDALPIATLSKPQANTEFTGDKARLPFSERYKYLLYIIVMLGIAGLVFLQYRVFRQVKVK